MYDVQAIVVHEVAPDLVGAVGETLAVARAHEDRGGIDRAGAQDENVGGNPFDLAVDQHLGGDDAPAAVVGDELQHLRAGLQFNVGMRRRRADQLDLGVALGVDLAGKRVAILAALAAPARAEIDGARHRERLQSLRLQTLFDGLHHRLVRYRRVVEILAAYWIGRIGAALAMHAEQRFGLLVPRFEVDVGDRPGGRDAFVVFDHVEVAFAETEHRRSVELGVAADVVEHARLERLVVGPPRLVGVIAPLAEDRFRVPVLRFARQRLAAFEDQRACAAATQLQGD